MCDFHALEAQPVQTTIYLLCAHVDEKKNMNLYPKEKTKKYKREDKEKIFLLSVFRTVVCLSSLSIYD